MRRVYRFRSIFLGALLLVNLAVVAQATAEEVICDPLPTDSVRLATFEDDESIDYHLYFPITHHGLDVGSAKVELTLARQHDCKSCEPVKVTLMHAGSRFVDNSIETFGVTFRLPKNVVGDVEVAARYSGYCAASMTVRLRTSEPESWPTPLARSDFRRIPRGENEDKVK